MYILTPTTNKECTFDTFFTVKTARKASTYDIVQLGCGARRSPQGFLGFFSKRFGPEFLPLLNMFIPREARFIHSLRARRVDVSDLQTWIPHSLQKRRKFFRKNVTLIKIISK